MAFISSGSGMLDFEAELRQRSRIICRQCGWRHPGKTPVVSGIGIEYVILERKPYQVLPGVPPLPCAGGILCPIALTWPAAGSTNPGSPSIIQAPWSPFRWSQPSSSTSAAAWPPAPAAMRELWGVKIPPGDYEKLAKILFCYDNPPGTKVISGSQDSIGLVFPGLAYSYYGNGYWPTQIEHRLDEPLLRFVENALYLIPLGPRYADFDVLADTVIDRHRAKALADAADAHWAAILDQDLTAFGRSMRQGFEAQVAMFPHMMNAQVAALIDQYRSRALGWKLSGGGWGISHPGV